MAIDTLDCGRYETLSIVWCFFLQKREIVVSSTIVIFANIRLYCDHYGTSIFLDRVTLSMIANSMILSQRLSGDVCVCVHFLFY